MVSRRERKLKEELRQLKEDIKLTRGAVPSMTVRKYAILDELNSIALKKRHILERLKGKIIEVFNTDDEYDFGDFGDLR